MERQDYTTKISYYIPNEKTYHFVFPLKILNKYNGPDNLDVTMDDNLTYFIIEPILRNQIEYNFKLIWRGENVIKDNAIDVCVTVNDKKFNPDIVIDNLIQKQMIEGLELYKEAHGKLIKVY